MALHKQPGLGGTAVAGTLMGVFKTSLSLNRAVETSRLELIADMQAGSWEKTVAHRGAMAKS